MTLYIYHIWPSYYGKVAFMRDVLKVDMYIKKLSMVIWWLTILTFITVLLATGGTAETLSKIGWRPFFIAVVSENAGRTTY